MTCMAWKCTLNAICEKKEGIAKRKIVLKIFKTRIKKELIFEQLTTKQGRLSALTMCVHKPYYCMYSL